MPLRASPQTDSGATTAPISEPEVVIDNSKDNVDTDLAPLRVRIKNKSPVLLTEDQLKSLEELDDHMIKAPYAHDFCTCIAMLIVTFVGILSSDATVLDRFPNT